MYFEKTMHALLTQFVQKPCLKIMRIQLYFRVIESFKLC